MPKIKFIFIVTVSQRDGNGNTYSHTRMIDTASGARVEFYGEKDTYASIASQLGLEGDGFEVVRRTVGKREFRAESARMRYGTPNDFIVNMNDEKKQIALAIKARG